MNWNSIFNYTMGKIEPGRGKLFFEREADPESPDDKR